MLGRGGERERERERQSSAPVGLVSKATLALPLQSLQEANQVGPRAVLQLLSGGPRQGSLDSFSFLPPGVEPKRYCPTAGDNSWNLNPATSDLVDCFTSACSVGRALEDTALNGRPSHSWEMKAAVRLALKALLPGL